MDARRGERREHTMIAADSTLLDAHTLLADWLLLIAAVLFVVHALILCAARPDPARGSLLPFGLACLAVALLVL